MNLPTLPPPDEVLALVLRLVLGPGVVLSLALITLALHGWYATFRDAYKKSRAVGAIASKAVRRMRWATRLLAAASIPFMLASQASWIALNYLAGNVIRGMIQLTGEPPGTPVPTWHQFSSSLHADTITTLYMLISAVCVVVSYVCVARQGAVKGGTRAMAKWFSFPWMVSGAGIVFMIGVVLALHPHGVDGTSVESLLALMAFGAACAGYGLTCWLVLRLPELVWDIWADKAIEDEGV